MKSERVTVVAINLHRLINRHRRAFRVERRQRVIFDTPGGSA